MTTPDLTLVIGDKNLSAWSLRGWLATKASGLPFDEILIFLDRDDTRERILEHSPAGKVPILKVGDEVIWDSLAIAETLADLAPDSGLWPADPLERARARALVSEMHSGFASLREECPMNLMARTPRAEVSGPTAADIRRVVALWRDALGRSGGPFLFGDYGIADAFYAPVATRFITYEIALDVFGDDDGRAAAYRDVVTSTLAFEEWLDGARAEVAG